MIGPGQSDKRSTSADGFGARDRGAGGGAGRRQGEVGELERKARRPSRGVAERPADLRRLRNRAAPTRGRAVASGWSGARIPATARGRSVRRLDSSIRRASAGPSSSFQKEAGRSLEPPGRVGHRVPRRAGCGGGWPRSAGSPATSPKRFDEVRFGPFEVAVEGGGDREPVAYPGRRRRVARRFRGRPSKIRCASRGAPARERHPSRPEPAPRPPSPAGPRARSAAFRKRRCADATVGAVPGDVTQAEMGLGGPGKALDEGEVQAPRRVELPGGEGGRRDRQALAEQTTGVRSIVPCRAAGTRGENRKTGGEHEPRSASGGRWRGRSDHGSLGAVSRGRSREG